MKKLQKCIRFGASTILVLGSLAPIITGVGKAAAFAGGNGTANSPYRVTSCVDLEAITPGDGSSGVHYALTQDIDCTGVNGGSGFTPIGSYNSLQPFEGVLDGRNFTITGVTINAGGQNGVGLFSYTRGATVENLKISGLVINGADSYAGSIVGSAQDTNLSGVSSTNFTINQSSSGYGLSIAGLAGQFSGSSTTPTISYSSASGSIVSSSPLNDIGGLVGFISSANVHNSYAALTLDDINAHVVGGLAGDARNTQFTNNYAAGNLNAQLQVGGFTSDAYGTSTFTNNFSVTVVSNSSTDIAGFIGYVANDINPSNSSNNYWDINTSGQASCSGGSTINGCTGVNADGSDASHFENTQAVTPLTSWDFGGTWMQTISYPTLQDRALNPIANLTTPDTPTGLTATNIDVGQVHLAWAASASDGGSDVTYHVQYKRNSDSSWTNYNDITGTSDDLTGLTRGISYDFQVIAENYSGSAAPTSPATIVVQSEPSTNIASCQQLQDIQYDLAAGYTLTGNIDCSGFNFTPIDGFTGTLGGQSHTISNLTIDMPGSTRVGIFAQVSGGSVHDLVLDSSDTVNGYSHVGLIAGYATGGSFYNLTLSGTVTGQYNFGSVVGGSDVDGGNLSFDSITSNAHLTKQVNSDGDAVTVGGLIGYSTVTTNTFSLTNSSYSGTLDMAAGSAAEGTGGLIGELDIYDDATATLLYDNSNGASISGGDNTGGIIGFVYADFNGVGTNPGHVTLQHLSRDGSGSLASRSWSGGLLGNIQIFHGATVSLSESSNDGDVSGTSGGIGGIVGHVYNDNSTITFSKVFDTGNIDATGNNYVGGLIGMVDGGRLTLSDSYAQGTVTGSGFVGGVAGQMLGDVSSTYASGAVSGSGDYIGGLIGTYDQGIIMDSFAAGRVSDGVGTISIGGLVGGNFTGVGSTISNAFFDADGTAQTDCAGDATSIYVAYCSTVNLGGTQPDYFFGNNSNAPLRSWDFDNTWQANDGDYPSLQFVHGVIAISDCAGLQAMASNLSADYMLTQDIDCSDTYTWNPEGGGIYDGFLPVGTDNANPFTGTLDGRGHTISNLYVNSSAPYAGLFGFIEGYAAVGNLKLTGEIYGGLGVGSIAAVIVGPVLIQGVETDTQVYGLSNTSDFFTDTMGVGGLVGVEGFGAVIRQSASKGFVEANISGPSSVDIAGGLVGLMLDESELHDSYSTATVTSSDSGQVALGGAVGFMLNYSSGPPIMTNVYAAGHLLLADGNIGAGLVGAASQAEVDNSFAAGTMTGGQTAGLIGLDTGSTFNGNYLDVLATGSDICVGGGDPGVGCTLADTPDAPNASYFFNNHSHAPLDQWDFDTVWGMNSTTYPTLRAIDSPDGGNPDLGDGGSGNSGGTPGTTITGGTQKTTNRLGGDNSGVQTLTTQPDTIFEQSNDAGGTTKVTITNKPSKHGSGTSLGAQLTAGATAIVAIVLVGYLGRWLLTGRRHAQSN